jgi:hypothetical protein
MAETNALTDKPFATRIAGDHPADYERAVRALSRARNRYFGLAIATLICGLGILGAGVMVPVSERSREVLIAGGGLVSGLSLVPFLQGWLRHKRLGFLAQLRGRWVQLARAGDPHDQIGALRNAYAGIVDNNLRARVIAGP